MMKRLGRFFTTPAGFTSHLAPIGHAETPAAPALPAPAAFGDANFLEKFKFTPSATAAQSITTHKAALNGVIGLGVGDTLTATMSYALAGTGYRRQGGNHREGTQNYEHETSDHRCFLSAASLRGHQRE